MGLFGFLKSKKEKQPENKIILAMPMFANGDEYQISELIDNIEAIWDLKATDVEGNNETVSFNINGNTIALAHIPCPILTEDIEWVSKYTYTWTTALNDTEGHTGHAILSIFTKDENYVAHYILLSKILCSLFQVSNAIGVYQGEQSLLISRKQYLNTIEDIKAGILPVQLWIYIGLRKGANSNAAYTYGLKEFKKDELEIPDSKLDLEELFSFLLNISVYLIGQNVSLKDGETVGYTPEHKVKVNRSKGIYSEGETLKLYL